MAATTPQTQDLAGQADAASQVQIPDIDGRSRTRRNIVLLLLLAAGGAAGFVYWTRGTPLIERYRSVQVETRTIVRVVEATGHLDARSRVVVSAPVAGHLAEISVAPGARVERGQLLARMDDRATALGVRSAGSTLEASVWRVAEARTAYESAQSEHQRIARLLERGLAAAQEVAAAKAQVDRARAVLKGADAEKSLAQDNVAVAKFGRNLGDIVSPIAGIVLSAPENVGVAVSPEHGPLFIVAEPLEQMRIDADVSEADIGDVKIGQSTRFEVQTFPGREFVARVQRIGLDPRREGAVVTYPVMLAADNADRALLPGMTAAVRIEIAQVKDALAVREAALRFTPEDAPSAEPRTRVWKHTGLSSVEPVSVTVGLSDGMYTEVRVAEGASLAVGDEVAVGLFAPRSSAAAKPGVSLGRKK